jgi:iron complex outermembrane receptor protein
MTTQQRNIVPPEKKTPGYGTINIQTGSQVIISKQIVQVSLQVHNLLNT